MKTTETRGMKCQMCGSRYLKQFSGEIDEEKEYPCIVCDEGMAKVI